MAIESDTIRPITDDVDLSVGFSNIELISANSHARVYRATCDGNYYLLKSPATDSGLHISLIKREWELGRGLAHPGLARMFAYEADTPVGPCIVMEYVEGRTLSAFIAEGHSLAERKIVFKNILDTVRYLHRVGIVHNDLKPDNILVANEGNRIKVIDFGLSDDDAHYLAKSIGGTSGYMSPELANCGKVDARSDIWSLGVIMKDLFSSRYAGIRAKCLRPDKTKRYASVNDLIRAWKLRKWKALGIGLAAAALLGCAIILPPWGCQDSPTLACAPDSPTAPVTPATPLTPAADTLPADSLTLRDSVPSVTATAIDSAAHKESISAVKQTAAIHINPDLSNSGTANCYIVPAAGDYSFKATVKGPSSAPIDGIAAKADLLWETLGTIEQPQFGALITNVSYSDGRIHFHATGTDGNAVIAIRDADDNILWSWHIWCCADYDPSATAWHLKSLTLMDRNLGATSVTPGDVRCFGLFYQYGRKDPFLGSGYTNQGMPVSFASIHDNLFDKVRDTLLFTQSYALAHPTSFFCDGKGILTNTDLALIWSDSKSENDPCPFGWRVPGNTDLESHEKMQELLMGLPWDSDHFGINVAPLLFGNDTEEIYWLPAAGLRTSGKAFRNVGTQIAFHTSYHYTNGKGVNRSTGLRIILGNIETPCPDFANWFGVIPCTALSVRCRKE